MKRVVVNRESLRALYPPMDAAFERDMRQQLASLPLQREEKRMKKKIGAGLALAMLLVLLAATALAAYAVSQGFFADVARIQLTSGYYDGWTLEEKEEVVRLMRENNLVQDMTPWDEALSERDETRREEALDALFAERYGIAGRTDVIGLTSILCAELGDIATWDMERKAWYTQLLSDADLLYGDDDAFFMPDEGAVSAEEAAAAAKEAVTAAYGLESGALDEYSAEVNCLVHISQMNAKPPYYEVWLQGEEDSYLVGVSQDGRVLSSEDGYLGMVSPEEEAAALRASEALESIPEDERLAEHLSGMESVRTREIEIAQHARVSTVTALADGSALLCGMASEANGLLAGLNVEGNTPFALCVDRTGTVLWKAAFPLKGDVCAAMQSEAGDILLLIKTDEADVRDTRYIHARIGADGTLGETLMLPLTEEVTGLRTEYEVMMGQEGHGGLLITRYAGTKNDIFYTQLDAQGSEVFTLDLSELKGYVPRLCATPTGYWLTAWNKQTDSPILRTYDMNGQKTAEYAGREDLKGLRVNAVLGMEDGSVTVTSFYSDESILARVGADGSLAQLLRYPDGSAPLYASELMEVSGGIAYLSRHVTELEVQHVGLMLFGEDGTARELRIAELDSMENWRGEAIPAALDPNTLVIGKNRLEEHAEDWSTYRESCRLIIVEL